MLTIMVPLPILVQVDVTNVQLVLLLLQVPLNQVHVLVAMLILPLTVEILLVNAMLTIMVHLLLLEPADVLSVLLVLLLLLDQLQLLLAHVLILMLHQAAIILLFASATLTSMAVLLPQVLVDALLAQLDKLPLLALLLMFAPQALLLPLIFYQQFNYFYVWQFLFEVQFKILTYKPIIKQLPKNQFLSVSLCFNLMYQ
ncbi:transmembrane protein, putative (macronuclear) [Tetrahymena thermophila SB210]|uniref:Transmembrane protein, putative n=1 Tax=Tetrahymena thermophila (strain SB210) TaxID=312017 RepID=W7XF01_TETTS|nr:transmembrane protein, putative [Tetrahymena thermophila SB210]EWS72571.1 transmembrane protein, putative [Tetrahymena thermophila SB210]|eukprot:XP_012654854.1 transmembrane protein, putative [Tetrahymena thermophila SB210]